MKAPAFWWDQRGALSALLSPLGAVYGAIAARRLAQAGERVGIPVICVGNPTVGGAGKTPAAIAIAKMLIAAGERPAFLTRGYGGMLAGPVAVETAHTSVQVGDEPMLLARVAPTIVASNRVAGARLAKEQGASVIVMDDGFQNPSLHKDLAILVIDGTRGVGNGCVIPAGPLRAPLAPQLARATAVLIVGDTTTVPLDIPSGVPLYHATLEPDAEAVGTLRGKKTLAFAGIGDPEKFFATLAAAGIEAPIRRGFADHHRYSGKEANALIADADRNGLQLLTTEKDLARLRDDAAIAPLAARTRALPVELRLRDADGFRKLVLGALKPA